MFSIPRHRICSRIFIGTVSRRINLKSKTSLTLPNSQPITENLANVVTNSIRFKSKGSGRQNYMKQQESDSDKDESDDDEENYHDRNAKVINTKVTSLRLDGLLKAGLNIARNKIEIMFYESRIRINGQKVFKKGDTVDIGDEIDIVKHLSTTNPKFLVVSRVEILNIKGEDDHIAVKLRRNKNLLIENYEIPWKPSGSNTTL